LLAQIAGQKSLTLFPPTNNEALYEGHIREGELSYSLESDTLVRGKLLESTSMVMSPIDIEAPNFEKFPLFLFAPESMDCTINEGEVLFLPAFWWHEVKSSPDISGRNIAVNFWYSPVLDKDFPCRTCKQFVSDKYNYLLDQLDF